MNHVQPVRGRPITRDDLVLQWTEHQCQRSAELMTDVGEECGLRLIDLRQRFRTLALRLVGPRTGQTRSDLRCNQIDKADVALCQWSERIEPHEQHSGWSGFALLNNRDRKSLMRRLIPLSGRKRAKSSQIIDGHVR